jgi:flagellar biosynthesis protein FlhG
MTLAQHTHAAHLGTATDTSGAARVGPPTARADQATRLRALMAGGTSNQPASTRVDRPAVSTHLAPAKVLTITSGKGGVGKTSIAVNLACAMAARGLRVTLVDMDWGLANADVLCGLSPSVRLDAALEQVDVASALTRMMIDAPGGFRLVPGAVGLGRLMDLREASQTALLGAMQQALAGNDIVVIDTGAGMGPMVRASALAADLTLVVVTPEPTSIADAYALIKALHQTARRRSAGDALAVGVAPPMHLLVNQALSPQEAAEVGERIAAVARRFVGVEIALAGAMLHDMMVPQAVRSRLPFVLGAPGSSASLAMSQLAMHVAQTLAVNIRGESTGRLLPPAMGFWDRFARLVGGRVRG